MTAVMDCQTARLLLLDDQRGLLPAATAAALSAHLQHCSDCAHEERAEGLLTEQLDRHLPQHAAPLGLKRRLAAQWSAPPWGAAPSAAAQNPAPVPNPVPALAGPAHRRRWVVIAASGVLAFALSGWLATRQAGVSRWLAGGDPGDRLVGEAVNDHLRVLARGSTLDVASGDMHQVRPWLTGRLDFAPVIPFPGDADFPLRGGAVEYFLDRRAAVLVYGRRRHTVTLIVTREDGLPWPEAGTLAASARGFNVRLWKRGGLGYALVSDLDPTELGQLARRLGG